MLFVYLAHGWQLGWVCVADGFGWVGDVQLIPLGSREEMPSIAPAPSQSPTAGRVQPELRIKEKTIRDDLSRAREGGEGDGGEGGKFPSAERSDVETAGLRAKMGGAIQNSFLGNF